MWEVGYSGNRYPASFRIGLDLGISIRGFICNHLILL